jgi:hypothetical protein
MEGIGLNTTLAPNGSRSFGKRLDSWRQFDALVHNLVLVSRNVRHFEKITDLLREIW